MRISPQFRPASLPGELMNHLESPIVGELRLRLALSGGWSEICIAWYQWRGFSPLGSRDRVKLTYAKWPSLCVFAPHPLAPGQAFCGLVQNSDSGSAGLGERRARSDLEWETVSVSTSWASGRRSRARSGDALCCRRSALPCASSSSKLPSGI